MALVAFPYCCTVNLVRFGCVGQGCRTPKVYRYASSCSDTCECKLGADAPYLVQPLRYIGKSQEALYLDVKLDMATSLSYKL